MLEVTCALIIRNKKLLVVQNNSNTDHPFQWEFPGGKKENRESLEACVICEIYEELEIEIAINGKMTSVEFDYGFKQIVLIPFLCSIRNGKINLKEHKSFKWIGRGELENVDLSGADKKLIQQKQNIAILKKQIGE